MKLFPFATLDPRRPLPSRAEKAKKPSERAEDVSYTMNHAIACTATDALSIPVSALTGRWLGRNVHIGCSHDHGGSWWRQAGGELVGDVGAVPLTLALQRYAPSVMNDVGHAMAIPLGPIYRLGAEHSTARWAKRYGVAQDSEEYRLHAEASYRREIEHLQLGGAWSVEAALGNIAAQKWLFRSKAPWWQLGLAKVAGSSVSVGGLFVARAAAPETAQGWDRWTGRQVFAPLTRLAAKPFGIDTQGLEVRHTPLGAWQDRIAQQPGAEKGRGL